VQYDLANETTAAPIRLRDYRRPPWSVDTVELDVDLGIDTTEVTARLCCAAIAAALPLATGWRRTGTAAISLDGHALDANSYRYEDSVLEVDGAKDGSVLETRVRLRRREYRAGRPVSFRLARNRFSADPVRSRRVSPHHLLSRSARMCCRATP
jgi:hypothetical protein